MYWLILATLYGTFAGFAGGSIISSMHWYGYYGDRVAWRLCVLIGAVLGLVTDCIFDVVSVARRYRCDDKTFLRLLWILAALIVLWMLVLPALQHAYE
jgi:hypothetical protein